MRVAVVIPAFNEEASIGAVVRATRALELAPRVIVVDDASGDRTGEEARAAGATVLSLVFNGGIGAAVQAGLRFALEDAPDLVVRVDGDGQHDPDDIPRLVEVLVSQKAQLVLASRYLSKGGLQTTRARRIGIAWFSLMLRWVCGLTITDPTSGFWAADREAAELLLAQYSSDYPEVDSLVYLHRKGHAIVEVPVVMKPRSGGVSSIQGPRSLFYMVKVTLALLMQRVTPR